MQCMRMIVDFNILHISLIMKLNMKYLYIIFKYVNINTYTSKKKPFKVY